MVHEQKITVTGYVRHARAIIIWIELLLIHLELKMDFHFLLKKDEKDREIDTDSVL